MLNKDNKSSIHQMSRKHDGQGQVVQHKAHKTPPSNKKKKMELKKFGSQIISLLVRNSA